MSKKVFNVFSILCFALVLCFIGCTELINPKTETDINLNIDLSKIIKSTRNTGETQSSASIGENPTIKVAIYDAKKYNATTNSTDNLDLITEAQAKIVNNEAKVKLNNIPVGIDAIVFAELSFSNGNSTEVMYAGNSEVFRVKLTDNKISLVLMKVEVDIEVKPDDSKPEEIINAKEPEIIIQPISCVKTTTESTTGGTTKTTLTCTAKSTDGGNLSFMWYKSEDSTNFEEFSSIVGPSLNGDGSYTSSTSEIEAQIGQRLYFYCVVTNTNENATGNKVASVRSNTVQVACIEGTLSSIIATYKSDSYELLGKNFNYNNVTVEETYKSGSDDNATTTITVIADESRYTISPTTDSKDAIGYVPYTVTYKDTTLPSNLTASLIVPVKYELDANNLVLETYFNSSSVSVSDTENKINIPQYGTVKYSYQISDNDTISFIDKNGDNTEIKDINNTGYYTATIVDEINQDIPNGSICTSDGSYKYTVKLESANEWFVCNSNTSKDFSVEVCPWKIILTMNDGSTVDTNNISLGTYTLSILNDAYTSTSQNLPPATFSCLVNDKNIITNNELTIDEVFTTGTIIASIGNIEVASLEISRIDTSTYETFILRQRDTDGTEVTDVTGASISSLSEGITKVTVKDSNNSDSVWTYFVKPNNNTRFTESANYKVSVELKADKTTVVGIAAARADYFFTVNDTWTVCEFETGYLIGNENHQFTIGLGLSSEIEIRNLKIEKLETTDTTDTTEPSLVFDISKYAINSYLENNNRPGKIIEVSKDATNGSYNITINTPMCHSTGTDDSYIQDVKLHLRSYATENTGANRVSFIVDNLGANTFYTSVMADTASDKSTAWNYGTNSIVSEYFGSYEIDFPNYVQNDELNVDVITSSNEAITEPIKLQISEFAVGESDAPFANKIFAIQIDGVWTKIDDGAPISKEVKINAHESINFDVGLFNGFYDENATPSDLDDVTRFLYKGNTNITDNITYKEEYDDSGNPKFKITNNSNEEEKTVKISLNEHYEVVIEEITTTSGGGIPLNEILSWEELVTKINDDTTTTEFIIMNDLTATSTITVSKPVKIISDEEVTITRGNSSDGVNFEDSFFRVESAGNLELGSNENKIILDGGNANESPILATAPLITSSGNLTLTNCTLQNNKNISTTPGGAINISAGTFTMNGGVIGSEVTENDGTSSWENAATDTSFSNYAAAGGGGVYVADGTVTINGGKISHNYTRNPENDCEGGTPENTAHGGGISIVSGSLSLINSEVSYNSGYQGGGIRCYNDNTSNAGTLTLNKTIIKGNTSNPYSGSSFGGGLMVNNFNVIFAETTESTIEQNYSGDGGALFLENTTSTLKNITIQNNSYNSKGYHYGSELLLWANANVSIDDSNVNIASTEAETRGIFINNNANTLKLFGDAKLDAPIYLTNGTTVTVAGYLSSNTPPVATITPEKYEEGIQVLTADGTTLLEQSVGKFALTPSADGTDYKIDADGEIAKVSKVNELTQKVLNSKIDTTNSRYTLIAGEYCVIEDIVLSCPIQIDASDGEVKIYSNENKTITCSPSFTAGTDNNAMIVLPESAGTLTLGGGAENLTIDGGNVSGMQTLISVNSDSILNLQDNCTITNGNVLYGAVSIVGGTFNMTGGEIKNNKATQSSYSGIYVLGNIDITGGSICDNYACDNYAMETNYGASIYNQKSNDITVLDQTISANSHFTKNIIDGEVKEVSSSGGTTSTYSVGDVYPKDGTPIGVVFKTDTEYVYIVGLDEGNFTYGTQNCVTYIENASNVTFNNSSDGCQNMTNWYDFITTNSDDFSSAEFPAFNYCLTYRDTEGEGGTWYLPSKEELSMVQSNIETLNNTLQNTLQSQNATPLATSYSYWSSTYTSAGKAYKVAMNNNGSQNENSLDTTCYVRPCKRIIIADGSSDVLIYGLDVDTACAAISNIYTKGEHYIKLDSNVTADKLENDIYIKLNENLSKAKLLDSDGNPTAFVYLDLSSTQITELPAETFWRLKNLSGVILPSTIDTIDASAFQGCINLTKFVVPADNQYFTVDESKPAILLSKYKSKLISYPSATGDYIIPNNITSLAEYAFGDATNLTSVTIYANLTDIPSNAFYGALYLKTFTVNSSNSKYTADYSGQILLSKDETELISWPYAYEDITIPDSVTKIADYALAETGITSVVLNNVEEIGEYAFYCCLGYDNTKFTKLTIPSSVTKIGKYAFYSCENLTSVEFADTNNNWTVENDAGLTESVTVTNFNVNNLIYASDDEVAKGYADYTYIKDSSSISGGGIANYTDTNGISISNYQYQKTSLVTVISQETTIDCSDEGAGVFTLYYDGTVTLSPFAMGQYEVTQELYQAIMTENPSYFKDTNITSGETQNLRPVDSVNWYQAVAFCNELTKQTMGDEYCVYYTDDSCSSVYTIDHASSQLLPYFDQSKKGYRLPTEAEWEFSARGGKETELDWNYAYPGVKSDSSLGLEVLCPYAWFKYLNSSYSENDKTHEVGLKKANRLSLYDMAGNVQEWCWDYYVKTTTETLDSIVKNPTGYEPDSSNSNRAVRGGYWATEDSYCYSTYRDGCGPATENQWTLNTLGFRICRSL